MSTKAAGYLMLGLFALGVIANMKDIKRYIRISLM